MLPVEVLKLLAVQYGVFNLLLKLIFFVDLIATTRLLVLGVKTAAQRALIRKVFVPANRKLYQTVHDAKESAERAKISDESA